MGKTRYNCLYTQDLLIFPQQDYNPFVGKGNFGGSLIENVPLASNIQYDLPKPFNYKAQAQH